MICYAFPVRGSVNVKEEVVTKYEVQSLCRTTFWPVPIAVGFMTGTSTSSAENN